jgi:hypothetical protein
VCPPEAGLLDSLASRISVELTVEGSTVGAQSIARAQSIAHSHIGNHIFEKNEIFKKLFLQKIRRVN